ncbi:MAG: TatD family hydrolase [Erysipelotrichaceae bacterium]
MNYIDSHAHIIYEEFDTENAMKHIDEVGFKKVMIVCLTIKQAQQALELARKDKRYDVAIGIHPSDVKHTNIEILTQIKEIAKDPYVVAVGEIGLDYYWDKENKEDQLSFFKQQIQIANEVDKPILIHSRDAIEDTLKMLKAHPAKRCGIMHCYSSSKEIADELVKMGYLISLAGPVTFKNAKEPKRVATEIALEHLLTETDCPFLTPEPFRGKTNEPSYVQYCYQKIADLKEVPLKKVLDQFEQNYMNLFHKK